MALKGDIFVPSLSYYLSHDLEYELIEDNIHNSSMKNNDIPDFERFKVKNANGKSLEFDIYNYYMRYHHANITNMNNQGILMFKVPKGLVNVIYTQIGQDALVTSDFICLND